MFDLFENSLVKAEQTEFAVLRKGNSLCLAGESSIFVALGLDTAGL